MARFVNIDYSPEHPGITRVTRGFEALRQLNFVAAGLHALAVIGAPLHASVARWAAARKQRAEDRKLWDLALTDARVMADLSRAMSQEAVTFQRYY